MTFLVRVPAWRTLARVELADRSHADSRRLAVRMTQGGRQVLCITRREGEKVVVAGELTVEVLEVRGRTVKLGFAGPRSITVLREEIVERAYPPPRLPPDEYGGEG